MARQPVSTQVQGNNLAVTAAPVDTMVQPTAPTGGQILLQQLANIDSGIKGIIGGVQQLSQTRLNQEVFELEQNKRIEAEAARLKNAEAQAAKEAEAARKAMLKKSQEEALEIARQKVSLAAANGDTSQLGSVIIEQANTGDSKGARDVATSIGKLISSDIQSQIATETQGMSDIELRSYDAESRAKQLFNEKAQGFGLSPDSLKYIDAGVVQEMQRAPQSALNTVVSQAAELKNKNDEAAKTLDTAMAVNEGAAKTLEDPKALVGDFGASMAGAVMDGDDAIAQAVHKSTFDTVVKSMDDLAAGVVDGSVPPDFALTKLKELKEAANTEVPFRDGKNITIASFGNGKFSDAYVAADRKIKSIKASQESGASVDNLWINSLVNASKDAASSGNKSRFDEITQTVVGSDVYNKLTPAQKGIVDKQFKTQEGVLYGNMTTTDLDRRDATNALRKGDNNALKDLSPEAVMSSVTSVAPVRFDPTTVANDVGVLRSTVGSTIKGNEAAAKYLSDTFKVQPINTPENFSKYAQVLTVLHNTDGEMFKKVISKGGDPRAARVFQVSKAVESMGGGVEEAMAAYKTLTSYSDINGEAAKSMESKVNATYNIMIADSEYPYAMSDYSTETLVKESIRANIIMGVPSQFIPNTVYNQVNSMYIANQRGTLSSANDGFGDEESRKEYADPKNLLDVATLIVTDKTAKRMKAQKSGMNSSDEAAISRWGEQLKDKYTGLVIKEANGTSYLYGILKRKGLFFDSSEDAIEIVRDNTGAALSYPTKDSANYYLKQQAKRNKESAFKNPEKAIELISPSVPQ